MYNFVIYALYTFLGCVAFFAIILSINFLTVLLTIRKKKTKNELQADNFYIQAHTIMLVNESSNITFSRNFETFMEQVKDNNLPRRYE
jgi:hypothetical protein